MYVLENNRLKVNVAAPGEVYDGSRFDWTGFITQITLDDVVTFCVPERLEKGVGTGGIGLSNEFGIDQPLGYEGIKKGQQFPKIGVGLLTKDSESDYDFFHRYDVTAAKFHVSHTHSSITFDAEAHNDNGYGFHLNKEISLLDDHVVIRYTLKNTGDESFKTNEYAHNFIGINHETVNENYQLTLPKMNHLEVAVGTIKQTNQQLTWPVVPDGDFYAHIEMNEESAPYNWEVYHTQIKAGVRDLTRFTPSKMALWGRDHVVSPEVFIDIDLSPGETATWDRCYQFYRN
ncbi:hypothetical protein GCM10012290_18690 [Halolactibacillus alkaliphilus]|uniref:Aldose 1-epimerase n=1 Tax=Halolactibacillus alkaliphilus TaxID=442899 RepID=A0A511X2N1_9BACI|nr:hypothetical protein [Halolactibacillus alkaliphilus]GEN57209.1 hypothetical protein HAL01_16730 [Halolactibacillus alkaliphilus]GGN72586.1 hypothetical protein GCM10012290_18690 [Halolactibacillus alkaliphilus]SFO91114.1 hypothetical protein SAMN05720591_12144 [Halolactibacillus alkaliphilus]